MEINTDLAFSNQKHNRYTDPFGLPFLEYNKWTGEGKYFFIEHFRDRDTFGKLKELHKPNVFLILTDVLEGYALRRFNKINDYVLRNKLQDKVYFATCLVNAEDEYAKWPDSGNYKTFYYPEWYHRVYDNLIDYKLHRIKYERTKYFCCLNNRPHQHRIETVDYLKNNNLLEKGIVTSVHHNINFDGEGSRPNDYNRNVYQHCLINLVTETHFYKKWNAHYNIFLSEKTWKPIVCKQAFILIGPKHSLNYLQQLGFKTFGDLWDESYDTYDDEKRLYSSLNTLYNIIKDYTLEELEKATVEIRKHNFKHFQKIRKEMVKTCW